MTPTATTGRATYITKTCLICSTEHNYGVDDNRRVTIMTTRSTAGVKRSILVVFSTTNHGPRDTVTSIHARLQSSVRISHGICLRLCQPLRVIQHKMKVRLE